MLVDYGADAIARRTGVARHDVAVVLGSGWGPAGERFGDLVAEVAVAELPGFVAPHIDGSCRYDATWPPRRITSSGS